MPVSPQLSSKAQQTIGLTPGTKAWSPAPFSGINLSASRPFIDDREFYWLENVAHVGDGYLRAVWDNGDAFYTNVNGQTIVSFFSFNIAAQYYFAIFFSDGTAIQVAYPSGAVTTISATVGTFYTAGSSLPACLQWGSQYLVIANNITQNSYWLWDGTLLYEAGSLGPIIDITDGGNNYATAPTVTIYGGTGTGVVATAIVNDGSVVAVTITNPGTGYLPGQTVQLGFSGGGSDTTPILEAVLYTGGIASVTLIGGGTNYPTGIFPLGISGGGGAGAGGNFTTSGGAVVSIDITSPGSGYSSAPTITFPIPGSGASITATESGGAVTALTIVSGGSGYYAGTYPLEFSGGSGTGVTGTYTVNGSGVVSAATLTAGGTGYTGAPTVSIPTGSGAAGVASITSAGVASITIVSGGTNLTGTPTLQITGGDGSGATAVATVTSGTISSVSVTNGGTGYISAPAVIVESALNNAAYATAELMPFGVSGTAMEAFQSRNFVISPFSVTNQNGGVFLVSAPESVTDFATSDGGLIFTSTDRFLRAQYMNIRQTNSYLYPFGDSSTSVISNVQTGGSPLSTTFNYQNVDPQIGMSWRDSCQDFGRTVLFANPLGIYGLYGGAVAKVSKKLDQLFVDAIFPPTSGALTPSSAAVSIYNVRYYLLLMTITDPFTGNPRNVIVAWNEQDWSIISQSAALVYIGSQEISSDLAAWGTDGTSLFPLLTKPSATLPKVIATKLYGAGSEYLIKELLGIYVQGNDTSEDQSGFSGTVAMNVSGIAQQVEGNESVMSGSFSEVFLQSPELPGGSGYWPVFRSGTTGLAGIEMGCIIGSTSPDFVLSNIVITYRELAANQ